MKNTKIFQVALAIACTLGTGGNIASAQVSVDGNGDYGLGGRQAQINWRVVDPDPDGLNCRGIPVSSDSLEGDPASLNGSDISQWPVVVTWKAGQPLQSPTSPGGTQIFVYDSGGQPWLPIYYVNTICVVRANSAYIQPWE